MIIGVGTDLIDIERVRKILEQSSGVRFIERVLTPEERKLAEDRKGRLTEFVAGRFAAKEAVVKALGCGIGKQVGFQDLQIAPGALGRPECSITKEALHCLGFEFTVRIHVSITHTETMAAAYAVAERV